MTKLSILVGILIGGSALGLEAQALAITEPAEWCVRYERTLAHGGPEPELRKALRRVPGCGGDAWGRSVAGAVSRLRRSANVAELDPFWRVSVWLRDARILSASLEIAGDNTASVPARVYALRSLLMLGRPDLWPEYTEMAAPVVGTRRPGGCHFGRRTGEFPYQGAALPPDTRSRIVAVANALQRDASEPPDVRAAARCVAMRV
jgi:hypothetical protein